MNCQLNKLRQKEVCQYGNNGEDGKTEEWISERGQSAILHLFQVTHSWNLTKLVREKIRSLLSVVSIRFLIQ